MRLKPIGASTSLDTMDGHNPQFDMILIEAVKQTIGPIAHMDKQYSGEQIQKMVLDYAGRAAKRKASVKAWTEVASDFTYSFFESLWKVFGESAWLDQVDFTWVVATAFRNFLSRPEIMTIPDEEFNQVFMKETALGLDCSRYYSWAAYVLKKIITGKASQKKVRDAVDNSREELLKQSIDTADAFVTAWITGTVKALGKDIGNVLPKATALNLFQSLVKEGGGIPLWLMNAANTSPECKSVLNEVETTINTLYADIPEDNWGGGGGGGKGAAKGFGGFGAAQPQWGAMPQFGGCAGGAWPGMGMGMMGYSPY